MLTTSSSTASDVRPGAHFGVVIDEDTILLRGELDLSAHDALHDAVAAVAEAQGDDHATIDLGGVTFIDSSGLRALVKVKRTHPAVHVINPTANVARLLEITGLSQVVIDN